MPPDRSSKLHPNDLQRFMTLIHDAAGLDFPETRRPDLERSLSHHAGGSEPNRLDAFYQRLRDPVEGPPALKALITDLTVGETYFLRDRPQFEALEQRVLPQILERHQTDRRLRLWSAACSTGEEAYSLAILLDRLLPDPANWSVQILATDINPRSLEIARVGIYGSWSFRHVPPLVQSVYFTQTDSRRYAILPRLKSWLRFEEFNLMDAETAWDRVAGMDLILCRNVLIYFSEQAVRSVASRLWSSLVEGGWLVLAPSEMSSTVFTGFEPVNYPGTSLYRKLDRTTRAVVPGQVHPTPFAVGGSAWLGSSPPAKLLPAPPSRDALTSTWTVAPMPPSPPKPTTLTTNALAIPESFSSLEQFLASRPLSQALEQLKLWCDQRPEDEALPYWTAKALANRHLLTEGREWIERVTRRFPLSARGHYVHGLILREQGEEDASASALRRCVFADPRFILGQLAWADQNARMGHAKRVGLILDALDNLLRDQPADQPVPEGDGLTIGQVRAMMAARRSL